jgi:hypothetical protein
MWHSNVRVMPRSDESDRSVRPGEGRRLCPNFNGCCRLGQGALQRPSCHSIGEILRRSSHAACNGVLPVPMYCLYYEYR